MSKASVSAGVPYRESSLCPRLNVGGQAVIEGVMMRSPRCLAVAVRRANSEFDDLTEDIRKAVTK